jgi:hypothetical protein
MTADPGDEIVQGAVLALHKDAEEAQAEKQEAEWEHRRARRAAPRVEGFAICADDPHAEHRHAEGPATRRPRVTEVEELPGRENDGDHDVCPAPADRMAGHDLRYQRSAPEAEGKEA